MTASDLIQIRTINSRFGEAKLSVKRLKTPSYAKCQNLTCGRKATHSNLKNINEKTKDNFDY